MEEWRKVIDYDGRYEVSNLGRVRRSQKARGGTVGRILLPHVKADGYMTVRLYRGGRNSWKIKLLHHVVAEAFIGPRPSVAHEINHKNGDPSDNQPDNLEWMTRADNLRHAYTHLNHAARLPRGEANKAHVLTEEQVREIKRLRASGHYQVPLAKQFGVSQRTIWSIVNGYTWNHIT